MGKAFLEALCRGALVVGSMAMFDVYRLTVALEPRAAGVFAIFAVFLAGCAFLNLQEGEPR